MSTKQILLSGFGGQGILFAGKFLAYKGLIDEKQVRDELASTGFKGFLRLLLYLLIMVFIYAYLFEYDESPDILVPYLNDIYKRILLFIMAVFLCFIIVRYDEKKFLLGSFLTVLLLYLSVYFAN